MLTELDLEIRHRRFVRDATAALLEIMPRIRVAVEAPKPKPRGPRPKPKRPRRPVGIIRSKGSSCVYVLKLASGKYKIGATTNLATRLEAFAVLGLDSFEVFHTIPSTQPLKAERRIHVKLRHCHVERELFNLGAAEIEWLKSIASL